MYKRQKDNVFDMVPEPPVKKSNSEVINCSSVNFDWFSTPSCFEMYNELCVFKIHNRCLDNLKQNGFSS